MAAEICCAAGTLHKKSLGAARITLLYYMSLKADGYESLWLSFYYSHDLKNTVNRSQPTMPCHDGHNKM